MRWMWIDQIVAIEPERRLVAVKNLSLAEEFFHDHFERETAADDSSREPLPIMPAPLIIEGMAQTGGILVGHTNGFREKVVLAKISKAIFDRDAQPGQTLRYEATLDLMDASGASIVGRVEVFDHTVGEWLPLAQIELIFSHIDQNRAGVVFPEENFVFTDNFRALLDSAGLLPANLS
ncbi:MAG: beta-hydroxyacyl-ACP dehydratase [Phycisphaerales bacterium]